MYVKYPFKAKASNACFWVRAAIAEKDERKRYDIWRNVFGNAFPKGELVGILESKCSFVVYQDSELFIEDMYFDKHHRRTYNQLLDYSQWIQICLFAGHIEEV